MVTWLFLEDCCCEKTGLFFFFYHFVMLLPRGYEAVEEKRQNAGT